MLNNSYIELKVQEKKTVFFNLIFFRYIDAYRKLIHCFSLFQKEIK